jgi:hypothetical protein
MSLSSIATPALRAAGLSEITFKKALQSDLTGNITVVVYSQYLTEEEVPTGPNPIFVRARSIQDDQAHLTDLQDIKGDSTRQRKEILKSYIAYLDASSPFRSQLITGKRWSAIWDGGNTVKLIAPEAGGDSMMLSIGSGASSAFENAAKQPVLTQKRTANAEIKLEASSSLQAQLNKYSHFSSFFDEFRKRLQATNFTSSSIRVNSLYRDGIGQARAMAGSRFKGDAQSLAYFRQWYLKTYTNAKSDKEIYNTIFGTEWTDPSKLISAMGVIYQKRIDAGYYKNKNSHSSLRSIDINTNKQPYSNVVIMLEVLESMKKDGIVKYYNWEEVWDHVKGNREAGLTKRRNEGVFRVNEHIHLGLIAGPNEGE